MKRMMWQWRMDTTQTKTYVGGLNLFNFATIRQLRLPGIGGRGFIFPVTLLPCVWPSASGWTNIYNSYPS